MNGGVFALGNFDGIHRGHSAVVEAAVEKAHEMDVPVQVLTFEPHPRSYFQPNSPPFRLTPPHVKERLLSRLGANEVITLPFTPEVAMMSAQDFVEKILLNKFGVQHLVAGHDFVFGHNRDGDMTKLRQWLKPHRISATEIKQLGEDGEVYSSTRTRELLLEGEPEAAAKILGRPWSIEGIVSKGAGLGGRRIGFPTANLGLGSYLRPKFGVYAVRGGRPGQDLNLSGIANIGIRPTINGASENMEVHLFDFNQDIYGQEWEFALLHFIRPEQKFANLEALAAQIMKDIEVAKSF